MLRPNELLIYNGNARHHQTHVGPDGQPRARGLVPRDYEQYPVGHYRNIAPYHAVDMPTIAQSEWSKILAEKVKAKALTSDVRMTGNAGQPIPALDQNGKGYCWAHSSTSANMMVRALNNEPYVGLSAYAVACIIKQYQDEGGWGAQSCDFETERGVPSEKFWPMQSMSRSNDKPETWANAALHKITEGWVDLQAAQYDRNLAWLQVGTLLLCNVPVVVDYNWWSHSVCAIDLVDGATMRDSTRDEATGKRMAARYFDMMWGMDHPVTAGMGVRILNSWGDSWSDHGMGTLASDKAVPDGSVAPRVVIVSPV